MKIDCAYDEMVGTDKLVPNPQNPNTHTEEQIRKLARLIELHGWRHPITVSNRSGFVNCGHARLDAAKLLNMKKVPVDRQDFESEAMEWAAMTSDNIVQELSLLDGQMMADGIVMLDQLNLDVEGLTSLDVSQIENYIDGPTMPTDEDWLSTFENAEGDKERTHFKITFVLLNKYREIFLVLFKKYEDKNKAMARLLDEIPIEAAK